MTVSNAQQSIFLLCLPAVKLQFWSAQPRRYLPRAVTFRHSTFTFRRRGRPATTVFFVPRLDAFALPFVYRDAIRFAIGIAPRIPVGKRAAADRFPVSPQREMRAPVQTRKHGTGLPTWKAPLFHKRAVLIFF